MAELRVEIWIARNVDEPPFHRRNVAAGGLSGVTHQRQNLLTVDRVTGRLADPDVIERLLVATEMEIFILCREAAVDDNVRILSEGLILLRLQPFDNLILTVQETENARV